MSAGADDGYSWGISPETNEASQENTMDSEEKGLMTAAGNIGKESSEILNGKDEKEDE
ncbi:MAG: hypothetical protein GY799_13375 [Desulfobulbaceae bacterium]|nr:hypothetical protein [Desulfobulbaceae bacterium]